MCGITGILNKSNVPVEITELRRMNDLIAHRGPDGEGFYTDNNLGFGHRRLAILDLSEDGHQPMHFSDKYVITYNGEIYNFIELRNELLKLGHRFKSQCDTEVILAAYDSWGEECVNHFNGMWSFAIHDKLKNKLFCSRDRFGVKPFYYKDNSEHFVFGSEIKQLISIAGPNKANKDLIAHYLFTGMLDHENRTFFSGIFKLPPSHNLTINLNNFEMSIKKYYQIQRRTDKSYEEVLTDAVKLRLRSDVKVGTCLSGGIDSSTIAAIAGKFYSAESGQQFSAIHAQSVEKETDESEYAKEVAKISNINLSIIRPEAEEFKKIIDEVVYTQEEPFGGPSIYLQYLVMKKAKELDCKVMLDGQGGDETLLGYERYFAPAFMNYFRDRGFITAFKEVMASNKNNSKMSFIGILKYVAGTYLIKARLKYSIHKNKWLNKVQVPADISYLEEMRKKSFNLFELQELELFSTNLPSLLRYEDKNSMRHGIETRLPFIDYRAVETSLSLDIDKKISNGWTKLELRKICAKWLSVNIAWRKNKLGFNAPDRTWLSSIVPEIENEIKDSKILKDFINNNIELSHPVSNNWNSTWRLYNLAVWERIYKTYI